MGEVYGIALPSAEGLDQEDQEAVAIRRQLRNATPEQAAQILQQLNQAYGFTPQPVDPRVRQAQQQQFATATDGAGNFLHPHFTELHPMMTRYAQMDRQHGVQPDLRSLYERALKTRPDLGGPTPTDRARAADPLRQQLEQQRQGVSSPEVEAEVQRRLFCKRRYRSSYRQRLRSPVDKRGAQIGMGGGGRYTGARGGFGCPVLLSLAEDQA